MLKKLQLNLSKSSYMILKLKSGWLPYSSTSIYLGVLFTDNGILGNDINRHTLDKSKSVSIKLANFVTNNLYAPITVKFRVLKSCVTAIILYACETWSYSNFWTKIKHDLEQNNDSSITKLYNAAIAANLPFIKHYITLHEKFANEEECFNFYRD